MNSNHTEQQPPVQMLKPKVVSEVLRQAITDGVTGAILMNLEGAPLAYSGGSDQQCDVISAIASNIWSASMRHGQTVFDDELTMQMFDCEEGRMCVCPVTSLLLCVFGAHTVPLGMLRTKTEALCRYLAGPLTEVTSAD